jgi:hypothetical protein
MAPSGTGRYVRTKEVQAAVSGREHEILAALGIRYHPGGAHIHCPYPDHDDRTPSWRFDFAIGRAFCSCISGDRKSDSILNVAMKVKRVDFEPIKIFVAETLGREDLINTKGVGGGFGQKTDAASLLDPPADNRDDDLPLLYLAGRLGIEPDQVPRPSTEIVGISSLPYFDPPAERGAKPELVGRFPCGIFETLRADGRRHAHRIYLNAQGTGKAELGTTAAGTPRDCKKSALRPAGAPSTAGCCVIWGGDLTHEHDAYIFEGIENAAVGAYCLIEQIERGEIVVFAAITAGGVEAFMPWPGTRRIIVGADRDEDKPPGSAGYKRGERAAHNLAYRLRSGPPP